MCQHDHELFAADSEKHVGFAQLCRQGVDHGTKRDIARLVSVNVVDLFEMVNVEKINDKGWR